MPARDPRGEAQGRLRGDVVARVLEPSPPAVSGGEWLADDPVGEPSADPGCSVVAPVPLPGARTWSAWVEEHPELAGWAAERWLAGPRTIGPPPPGVAETRLGLHRLAVYAVSPARRRENGKIGLRWTLGGFGTPFFGVDRQVRVEGARLVVDGRGGARSAPVTSLAEAAALTLDGPPDLAWAEGMDVPAPGDPDAPLAVDEEPARWLGRLFGFGTSLLEEVRHHPDSARPDAARVQLWPEHFDAAVDVTGAHGGTVTLGVSPGDAAIPEAYLYVLPHDAAVEGDRFWNADAFPGALVPVSEVGSDRAAARDFLLAGVAHGAP